MWLLWIKACIKTVLYSKPPSPTVLLSQMVYLQSQPFPEKLVCCIMQRSHFLLVTPGLQSHCPDVRSHREKLCAPVSLHSQAEKNNNIGHYLVIMLLSMLCFRVSLAKKIRFMIPNTWFYGWENLV